MLYDEVLEKFLIENRAEGRLIRFDTPVRSIEEAKRAAKVKVDDLIKTLIYFHESTGLIAIIVRGDQNVDQKALKKLISADADMADASEVLRMTGYPIGGVPPIGFPAKFFIDERVMEKQYVFGGGGSPEALLKITPKDIVRLTNAKIVQVGKAKESVS